MGSLLFLHATRCMQAARRGATRGPQIAASISLSDFCQNCGSTVLWEPSRKPETIAVAVGAFADPAFPPPSKVVYEQHRHPWVEMTI